MFPDVYLHAFCFVSSYFILFPPPTPVPPSHCLMDLVLISTCPRMTWRLSDPPQVTQGKPESAFPSLVPHSLVLSPQMSGSSSPPFSSLSPSDLRRNGQEKRHGPSRANTFSSTITITLVPSSESAWLWRVLSLGLKFAAPLELKFGLSQKKATS